MNKYEAMFLLDNRDVKKDWEGLEKRLRAILAKHGAEVRLGGRWDERKLAYEVRGHKRATFYLAYLEAPPEAIEKIRRECHLFEPVIREMILAVDEIPAELPTFEGVGQLVSSRSTSAAGEAKAREPRSDGAEVATEGTAERVVEAEPATSVSEGAPVEAPPDA